MEDFTEMSDEEIKRTFFLNGVRFFSWNSGKNTPNILLKLSENVFLLNDSLKAASDSSTKLAQALNRITLAAVIISAVGLLIAAAAVIVQIVK